jgi:hypothetical protein
MFIILTYPSVLWKDHPIIQVTKKKKKEIQFSQDSRGPKSPFFLGCAGVAGNDYPIYKIL